MTTRALGVLGWCLMTLSGTVVRGDDRNAEQSSVAQAKTSRYEFEQRQMGVLFKIILYAHDRPTANKAASAAFDRIEQLNRIMSDYDSTSELMRLCKNSRPGKPVKISPDLRRVLSHASLLSRQTNGAFDVTVGHLTKLWRRARRQQQLPDNKRLRAARELVGHKLVKLDERASTVELLRSAMRLDLGGIAKGFAADEALLVLKRHGIERAMVDGSGDIVVGEPPPGRDAWKIGIASLTKSAEEPTRFVYVKNASIATSGDAYQFVEIDGERYSHLIDPRSGIGLTSRSSVTVIAGTCMQADSLASAISVLGVEAGFELIKKSCNTAALFVTVTKNGTQIRTTERFNSYEKSAKRQ